MALVSRKIARTGLKTLFLAEGSWNTDVFDYRPRETETGGRSPFLTIEAVGTAQSMDGASKNPASMVFVITSFVATNDNENLKPPAATDKVDELDQVVRQLIRDNALGGNFSNGLEFIETPSNVVNIPWDGNVYLIEARLVRVDYPTGVYP